MTHPCRSLLVLALCAFGLALAAGADSRPAVKQPKVVWQAQTGAGVSAPPALLGKRLVVGTGWGGMQLLGLDAKSGERMWERQLDDNGVGAVVADGEHAYVTTESCTIYSVPTKSGNIAWKRWLGDPVLSSPAIADGSIYVGSGTQGNGKHYLLCLGQRDGSMRWKTATDVEITGTPTVVGDLVVAALNDGALAAFRRKDGKLVWRKAMDAAAPPSPLGDGLLVSMRQGSAVAFVETASGEVRWSRPLGEGKGNAGGAQLFTMASVPVPSGGKIYVGGLDGALHCLSQQTGAAVWSRPLMTEQPESGPEGRAAAAAKAARMSAPIGTPVPAHGRVYVGSVDGRMHCVNAATGEILWQFDAGGAIRWAPLVHDGKLYFTTDAGRIVCLDSGDPLATGWTQWGGTAAHTMTRTAGAGTDDPLIVPTPSDEDEE